jgi:hypothetical protein
VRRAEFSRIRRLFLADFSSWNPQMSFEISSNICNFSFPWKWARKNISSSPSFCWQKPSYNKIHYQTWFYANLPNNCQKTQNFDCSTVFYNLRASWGDLLAHWRVIFSQYPGKQLQEFHVWIESSNPVQMLLKMGLKAISTVLVLYLQ